MKTHSYYPDGQLAGITYTNSQFPTPNVSFTYDPIYGRLSQMTDGTGSTIYGYHPVDGSTFGAGNLYSINGPLSNDTILFTYDALGRPKTRSINGNANLTTVDSYDAIGRVTQVTNPLGTFTHTYDPVNLLPNTVTAPNGLSTTFDYETAAAALRLKEIKYQLAGPTPLSTHGYTYSPSGNIKTWSQSTGTNPANTWGITYDRADQLEAATLTNPAAAVLEHHAWRYDKIGNRTSRQNGPQITQTTHNNRNQIVSETAGGWMRVRGSTNEPATVRVKSNANAFTPATLQGGNQFAGWVTVVPGANSITVEAKDRSPAANTKINSYTINVTGSSRTPTYDLNGNTTDNGNGQTYQWDAENRLIKIIYADNSSTELAYDGLSRRTRIFERDSTGITTFARRYIWAGGNQPAEERSFSGILVLKQYHPQGELITAATAPLNKLFYTKDHLGSVRELVDANGTLQTRYGYDMWGKRTKLSGTIDSDVGYTGHHYHAESNLHLTLFRAYDQELGRWLSADPIGEMGGLNLYGYVENNTINRLDSLGLWTIGTGTTIQAGVGVGGGFSLGLYIGHDPDCGFFDGWSGGILGSGELGFQTPGASVAPFVAYSNAHTVDQLKGMGMVMGGSGGGVATHGVTLGYEQSRGFNTDSRGFPTGLNGITGHQVTVGPGAWGLWSPIPAEGHGGASYTIGPTIGANNGGCP